MSERYPVVVWTQVNAMGRYSCGRIHSCSETTKLLMHNYATDQDERSKLIGGMMLISVIIQQFIDPWVQEISVLIGVSMSAPSAFVLFSAIYWIFKRFGWKWAARAGVLSLTDLNGTWIGELDSSYTPLHAPIEVRVRITQNWNRISIDVQTGESESESRSASLRCNAAKTVLTYTYANTPKGLAEEGLSTHSGTAVLKLSEEGDQLIGRYYTGRDRQTYGELLLRRL
jgi:hypothetical protein